MEKPKIIAYLKPTCGWSQGVRAVLRKYDLPFEDRDIINDPLQRQEMIEKSGQMLSPCVEINGHMLADISGEEVEAWMLANKIVTPNDRDADAPTNQPCAHEMPASAPLNLCASKVEFATVRPLAASVTAVLRRHKLRPIYVRHAKPASPQACYRH